MRGLYSKIMDILFPVGGGTIGASTQIQNFIDISKWNMIWDTILVAAIGAIVGYLVKKGLDYIFEKCKPKA